MLKYKTFAVFSAFWLCEQKKKRFNVMASNLGCSINIAGHWYQIQRKDDWIGYSCAENIFF